MYNYPNPYLNSYNVNQPLYNSSFMSRSNQETSKQVVEAILTGIKGEATAIDFYSRLANLAPNQNQKMNILHVLEDEKIHWRQLTDLYINFTGKQPVYQIKQIPFHSFREGLQKAYKAELKNYEDYRNSYVLTQNSPVRDVFLRACNDETEHANRLWQSLRAEGMNELTDYGGEPFIVNIDQASKQNNNYRTALWTGEHLQVTLMSIDVGEDIGLEVHPDVDQFLRVEEGEGLVRMGDQKESLDFEGRVRDDYAIMVPAGKWHNLINTGDKPLKLYSIYAPPKHPFGTVQQTKAIAMAAETE
mgnify:CR=1 FL=1